MGNPPVQDGLQHIVNHLPVPIDNRPDMDALDRVSFVQTPVVKKVGCQRTL
jgi:hypothetical protein